MASSFDLRISPLRIIHASSVAGRVVCDSKVGKWKYWGWLKAAFESGANIDKPRQTVTIISNGGKVNIRVGNEAVEQQVKLFLSKLKAVSKERLMELTSARNEETYKVACEQAQKDFENTQKQVTALEEEAVKALTGESKLDLSIVNQMLLKHRAKLKASQAAMEEAQTRMQEEQENAKATRAQVDELLSWVECFEKADIGTKHLHQHRIQGAYQI